MKLRMAAVSICALLAAPIANAETVFDTINVAAGDLTSLSDGPAEGSSLIAQSFFLPGTPDFSTVTLLVAADDITDGGSTMVYLVPDDGSGAGPGTAGLPQVTTDVGGTIATGFANSVLLGTINDSSFTSSGTPTQVTLGISQGAFATVAPSTSNSEYWIAIVPGDTASIEWSLTAVDVSVGSGDGSGVGADGQYYFDNSGDLLGFSADQTNGSIAMTVDTPEPATLAILGGGITALGYARRRRAQRA